jgi:hypothetical protein
MDPNRAFPFDKTNRVRHTVFKWYAQTQMDVVRHRMPVKQFDAFLPAQIPDDRSDLFPEFPVDRFFPVLRYKNNMIFAVSSDV